MGIEPIEVLRKTLEKRNRPISISEIARESQISRTTAARYLDQMYLSGQVKMYEVGKAKKYQIVSDKNSHNLCDLSTNFVLVLDKDLRVVFVNDAYLGFSHIIPGQVIGKRIESLNMDIFSSPGVFQILRKYRGEGVECHTIEVSINNQSIIYGITIAKVQFGLSYQAIALIAQDITEKQRLEDQIRFLASIVGYSEDAIIGVGLDFRIISWNMAAERLFGYPAHDVIGKDVCHVFPHENEKSPAFMLNKILSGEMLSYHMTHQVLRKGSPVDVSLNLSQIRDHDEEIVGISIIVRDITDLKSIQKALIQSKEKINILSSITRHDILNQLQALDLFTDLLKPLIQTNLKATEYLSGIGSCSKNIKEHIQFTRDYQNIGDNVPSWQNIGTIIKMAAIDNIPDNISLQIKTGDYEIFADPMLMHVFFNLVENCVRHGGDVSTILVSVVPDKSGGGMLIVEDDGAGIPHDLKSLIFEKGIGKNSGLGLFLVREILAITGLEISETGEEGKGARFEVQIPPQALRRSHR